MLLQLLVGVVVVFGSQPFVQDQATLAAIRQVVTEYYKAVGAEDLAAAVGLFRSQSDGLAARRDALSKVFADNDKFELKSVDFERISVDGDKAHVRVSAPVTAVDVKSTKAATPFGSPKRALHLMRDTSNNWKLEREEPASSEIATALAGAKTEAERSAILEAEKDYVNVELVNALESRARNAFMRRQFESANPIIDTAESIARKLSDELAVARVIRTRGFGLEQQSKVSEALESYGKALEIAEKHKDYALSINILRAMGVNLGLLGRVEETFPIYEKAVNYAVASNNHMENGIARYNLGMSYYSLGDSPQATDQFGKSLDIFTRIKFPQGIARALMGLGNLELNRGDYSASLAYYSQALDLVDPSKPQEKESVGLILTSIGIVHDQQNNQSAALASFRKALSLYEELKMPYRIAELNMRIGMVYDRQYENTQALEQYRIALRDAEAAKVPFLISSIQRLMGLAYLELGQAEQAEELITGALRTFEQTGNKADVAYGLYDLALVKFRQRQYENSLELLGRSRKLLDESGRVWAIRENDLLEGKCHRAMGQSDKARAAFDASIERLEDTRYQVAGESESRQQFFENKLEPYHVMISLLIDGKQTAEAFAFSERAKARVLIDSLARNPQAVSASMKPEEIERESSLTSALARANSKLLKETQNNAARPETIAQLERELQKAQQDRSSFVDGLYAKYPELRSKRGQMKPVTVEETASLIDASSAALSYALGDERSFVFVLTHEPRLRAIDLKTTRKQVSALVKRYREQLAQRSAAFNELGTQLYSLLVAPVSDQLRGKSRLIIAPDAELWELPFQALNTTSGRYLIEDYALSLAPSLTALREMRRSSTSNSPSRGMLAMGNPVIAGATSAKAKVSYRNITLDPLPEAEREVNVISKMYRPQDVRIYTGVDAREDRFRNEAAGFGILHLATHGILDDASPMYSYVVLASSDQQSVNADSDGLLQAWEVSKLNLRAKLVVLSACETGRGRVGRGEGIIGLSWAFLIAGTPATLVSQWKVESTATTDLMIEFHRAMTSSKLSKAKSLQAAARKLIAKRESRHPFYWAGFVLVGEGS